MTSPPDSRISTSARGVFRSFTSETAIYGVVVLSGLIFVKGLDEEFSSDLVIDVLATAVIFWAAHVFAGTISHWHAHPGHDGAPTFGASFRAALRHSRGMLVAGILPAICLIFGAYDLISDSAAVSAALGISVIILGVLGFIAVSRGDKRWWVRLLAGLLTALFGAILIVLEGALH